MVTKNGKAIFILQNFLATIDYSYYNIQGDAFRLIVKIEFRLNAVYIRFLGTHTEYDTINACEV